VAQQDLRQWTVAAAQGGQLDAGLGDDLVLSDVDAFVSARLGVACTGVAVSAAVAVG
jgi:hypothetical protein